MKYINYLKICFKITDTGFWCSFNISADMKMFCCPYGILKKRPFARLPKLFMQSLWNFLDMVLLVSMSKERCNPGFSFSKQKLCCNLPPAAHVMIEWHQKGFNFTETVNNHNLNQQRARQFSRFISHFSLKWHTQFWKYFYMVLFRIGSDYCKK